MKKILIILMAAMTALWLAACGQKAGLHNTDADDSYAEHAHKEGGAHDDHEPADDHEEHVEPFGETQGGHERA